VKGQRQDQRKRELCAANGVTLIEWKYTMPISQEMLLKELARLDVAVSRVASPGHQLPFYDVLAILLS